MMKEEKGLYQKYNITKSNGKELADGFQAIVLRVDGGQYVEACRAGVQAFADAVKEKNPTLSRDLNLMLLGYEMEEHKKQIDPSSYRYE